MAWGQVVQVPDPSGIYPGKQNEQTFETQLQPAVHAELTKRTNAKMMKNIRQFGDFLIYVLI
jgi:hypothetical protein